MGEKNLTAPFAVEGRRPGMRAASGAAGLTDNFAVLASKRRRIGVAILDRYVMRHRIYLIALFLFVAISAQADPINVAAFPPRPDVLSSLLIEVLVVAAVIWRFRLRMVRFLVAWYVVNLLTFYVLLQGLVVMLDSFIIGEFAVFVVEAAALFGLSRLSFFRTVDSKPMPLGWAVAASVVGNLSSILSFIGITALE